MKLKIERRWKKATYTIGRFYIDGIFYFNSLEDKDRGLKKTDPLSYIKSRKVAGETAIPTGTYEVTMNVTSPKYAAVPWYWKFCQGKMPRILDVPGFDGILIHPLTTALDTKGCVGVGKNTQVGKLTQSKESWKQIYKIMRAAADKGEKITIEIV